MRAMAGMERLGAVEAPSAIEGAARVARSDFGLAWNKVIEGTQVVGDDVKIELHVEADKE